MNTSFNKTLVLLVLGLVTVAARLLAVDPAVVVVDQDHDTDDKDTRIFLEFGYLIEAWKIFGKVNPDGINSEVSNAIMEDLDQHGYGSCMSSYSDTGSCHSWNRKKMCTHVKAYLDFSIKKDDDSDAVREKAIQVIENSFVSIQEKYANRFLDHVSLNWTMHPQIPLDMAKFRWRLELIARGEAEKEEENDEQTVDQAYGIVVDKMLLDLKSEGFPALQLGSDWHPCGWSSDDDKYNDDGNDNDPSCVNINTQIYTQIDGSGPKATSIALKVLDSMTDEDWFRVKTLEPSQQVVVIGKATTPMVATEHN